MRDWDTGRVLNNYNLGHYERQWGNVYNMFHRQDMHAVLLDAATSPTGKGAPCNVYIDHMYALFSRGVIHHIQFCRCQSVDTDNNTVTFKNGKTIKADLIVGADGIRVYF